MVLIVHGFPNNISALRFEWAWQNPTKTIRLQHLNLKRIPRKETEFQFKLRTLTEMLRVGPWYRLPLTIRWLEKDYYEEFPVERIPPEHMKICHGPVRSRNIKKSLQQSSSKDTHTECLLCSSYIINSFTKLSCLNPNCELLVHITCLADLFLQPGEFVPIQGNCPFCSTSLRWGDLIRKMKGCNIDNNDLVNDCNDPESNENNENSDDDVICSQDKVFVDNNSRWLLECDNDYL